MVSTHRSAGVVDYASATHDELGVEDLMTEAEDNETWLLGAAEGLSINRTWATQG